MKRIDIVYEKLKACTLENGISAKELADLLQLDRANVSSDLNKLWKAGKVKKSSGRPVLFSVKKPEGQQKTETKLDQLMKENPSMAAAVEQGKAAILYPPRGMHTLIMGETGVGKSMFAKLLHGYGVEVGKLRPDAPFVTFNCADYAHNPQLLLGQLFGVKKGAYTGAVKQKGLIEKADGGILLLDEIHRLPAEGQEMLFTFIDQGVYRRLGETETEQRADVLILCATTEEPESSLLQTFRRRIPMTIRLLPLRERSVKDRSSLVFRFFREEAERLGKEIYVSSNSIRALLYYPCPHNIGQLKTDIQLLCAKAYADLVTMKKEKIQINSSDLPNDIKEGLFIAKRKNDQTMSGHRYTVFHPGGESRMHEPDETDHDNIYENIERKFDELKARGISDDELDVLMEIDIENYFKQYLQGVHRRIHKGDLGKVIDPEVIALSEAIIQTAESRLCKIFPRKVVLGMALHLQTLIHRIKHGKKIVNPQLNKIRSTYKQEFSVAWDSIKMIEERFQLDLPIDEAGFLTMFLVWDDTAIHDADDQVSVMVMMHGSGCATAMAEVTNQLLGTNHVQAIDMPLQREPMEVYNQLKQFVQTNGCNRGMLVLADMGSLLSFGDMLQKELDIPVKVIAAASTPHVLEATRKAMLGYPLDKIYEDVTHLTPFYLNDTLIKNVDGQPDSYAIVTACLTGQGSALAIKKVLENYLRYDSDMIKIIPVNILNPKEMDAVLTEMKKNHRLLCVISNFPVAGDRPSFHVEDVLSLQAVQLIQEMIDTEETYVKMAEALKNHLVNMEPKGLIDNVRQCVGKMEKRLDKKIGSQDLIGVVLHISCMVDRLVTGNSVARHKEKEAWIRGHPVLYHAVKTAMKPLEETYRIAVKDDEICYIMGFFQPCETLS
ncbi:sigma 54-interacting transcriptional regulator [Desmospora profundinema]|uniref:sigma 54-interacting transcriptional regulator n=1 Tax=Desmospora profundinema TaxID=1571184 RepID=UPI00286AA217|nr:sigma 54-interacting transcriptional regulator [Desmospora profundinema]